MRYFKAKCDCGNDIIDENMEVCEECR